MVEFGFFGRKGHVYDSLEPENHDSDIEERNHQDEITDFAKEALSLALKVSAAENASAGDIIEVPLPDTAVITDAAELRTEIAALNDENDHPLCIDICENNTGVFQCISPQNTSDTNEADFFSDN